MTPLAQESFEVWKYLVEDFLETGLFLGAADRDWLVSRLTEEKISAESIEPCQGFRISGKWIAAGIEIPDEVWMFDLNGKQMTKFKLLPM